MKANAITSLTDPAERLREFRAACTRVSDTWALSAASDDDAPVPAVAALGLIRAEPVLHELAHVVTFPIASPVDSSGLAAIFESLPGPISDRFEIAAWMVERYALNCVGAGLGGHCWTTHTEAAHAAANSVDNTRRWTEKRILSTMKVWQRHRWVRYATEHLFDLLIHRQWLCAEPLPKAVWRLD